MPVIFFPTFSISVIWLLLFFFSVEQAHHHLMHAPGVIADLPDTRSRKIGSIRILQREGERMKVGTDTLAWATFFRQHFDNKWTDTEVIAKVQPHLGSSMLTCASVIRGLRKGAWECCVQMQFESPEATRAAAISLRAGGFHAGACKPSEIVDRVIHNIGTHAIEYVCATIFICSTQYSIPDNYLPCLSRSGTVGANCIKPGRLVSYCHR